MAKNTRFCPNCKSILSFKKDSKAQPAPYCNICGFVKITIDPNAFSLKVDLTKDHHETVVIDRSKQIEQLKKEMGERNSGPSCPNCKSFYLTRNLLVTRGDEAGKTFWNCVQCGYQFRRPIYIDKPSSGK